MLQSTHSKTSSATATEARQSNQLQDFFGCSYSVFAFQKRNQQSPHNTKQEGALENTLCHKVITDLMHWHLNILNAQLECFTI